MSTDDAQARLERAAKDFAAGRFTKAADGFRAVIRIHPDVGELYINLGAALRADKDTAGAEQAYRDAIKRAPKSALAWFNLANLMRDLKRADEALAAYQKADSLQPGTAEILNNLGVQLYDMGAVEGALKHYDMALAVNPGFADAIANRGNALQRLCRMDEAETAIDAALGLAPDNAVYQLNKASFLAANGRHSDALTWANKAIEADSDYIEAKLKRAGLLIQTGNLKTGFSEYEVRWKIPDWHPMPARLSVPAWQGEEIDGKDLVLWNEQGFGDALMYARYLPLLLNRGARITLMCEQPLVRLFKLSFGNQLAVIDLNAEPPKADLHASLMSLPHLLETTLETIPGEVPYLTADVSETKTWRRKLSTGDDRPMVGLIWAGNPGQAHDYARSIPVQLIEPLLSNEHIRFFNLLVGPRGNQLRHENFIDYRQDLDDFAATAALMSALDLVISVDSAPAHLAGALARPLRVLLSFDPDSRYFLNTASSPWYPSATLLRQPMPGDWASVISAVQTGLNDFVETKAKS